MTRPDEAAVARDLARDLAVVLVKARTGDRAAFGALVQAHQSAVRWQLRRLTAGDAALADDLAQDTFVQAWRHLATFDGRARFGTWLHRIAVREFLQHRRRPVLAQFASAAMVSWLDDEPAGSGHGPGAGLHAVANASGDADVRPAPLAVPAGDDAAALRLDVERALARLSEAQRLCVVHCFHLDLTHEEAADVLGLPLGTLKSHLNRARARLQELLGAWAEDLP